MSDLVNKRPENLPSVEYEEQAVAERAEVMRAIKALGRCNLFLVGRSPQSGVPRLVERTDCTELGPVGSYLACSEFSTSASVLVIQRYDSKADPSKLVEEVAEIEDMPDTPLATITPESSHQK